MFKVIFLRRDTCFMIFNFGNVSALFQDTAFKEKAKQFCFYRVITSVMLTAVVKFPVLVSVFYLHEEISTMPPYLSKCAWGMV